MSSPDLPPQPEGSHELLSGAQEPDLSTHEGQLARVQELEAQRRVYEATQPAGEPLEQDPAYIGLVNRLAEARRTLTAFAAKAAVKEMTDPSST